MKSVSTSIFTVVLALGLTSTAGASNLINLPLDVPDGVRETLPAQAMAADAVDIPVQITESESLGQYISEMVAIQGAELVWLDAQTKYFEIMRASFVASRAMTQAYEESKVKQTGVSATTGVVTVVADIYLAKAWLAGAAPTVAMVKDILAASRGNTGRMTAIGQKTFASLKEVAKALKVPKNFVTTAALGTFVIVQVEGYFIINMSEAQYQENIRLLDAKIAALQVRKAAVADKHVPYSVR